LSCAAGHSSFTLNSEKRHSQKVKKESGIEFIWPWTNDMKLSRTESERVWNIVECPRNLIQLL
jgi:hypothetical protein